MNPDVQVILSYYAHYIMLPYPGTHRMYTREEAIAAAFARRPEIRPAARGAIARQVYAAAQRGEAVARAVEAIGHEHLPGTLGSVLGGYQPPAAEVQVRFVYQLPDGHWRTQTVNAFWSESIGEVVGRFLDYVTEDSLPGVGRGDVIWDIRGPTLLPSQQSQ